MDDSSIAKFVHYRFFKTSHWINEFQSLSRTRILTTINKKNDQMSTSDKNAFCDKSCDKVVSLYFVTCLPICLVINVLYCDKIDQIAGLAKCETDKMSDFLLSQNVSKIVCNHFRHNLDKFVKIDCSIIIAISSIKKLVNELIR